jgi:hypothetical protein
MPLYYQNNQILVSNAHQTAPYTSYDLKVQYFWNNGNLAADLAYNTGPSPSVPYPASVGVHPGPFAASSVTNIQVSQPRGFKIVSFRIRRKGFSPVAPDPIPVDPNEKLLHAQIQTIAPILDASLTNYSYGIWGVYVYSLDVPKWFSDGFSLGDTEASIDTGSSPSNVLTSVNFSKRDY